MTAAITLLDVGHFSRFPKVMWLSDSAGTATQSERISSYVPPVPIRIVYYVPPLPQINLCDRATGQQKCDQMCLNLLVRSKISQICRPGHEVIDKHLCRASMAVRYNSVRSIFDLLQVQDKSYHSFWHRWNAITSINGDPPFQQHKTTSNAFTLCKNRINVWFIPGNFCNNLSSHMDAA